MKKHKVSQKSDEWHFLRKGKITGTILKGLMGTKLAKENAIYDFIAQKLTKGLPDEDENPMDRGNRLEPEAIAQFEFETGKRVERVGFCEDDDESQIANSPDGLIGQFEAIEVKCMGGKNHIKLWLTNEIPDDYFWQVVQYFVVNKKLKKLYFVGYNPDIPLHPLHIIEVPRSKLKNEIEEAEIVQKAFLAEVKDKLQNIIKL